MDQQDFFESSEPLSIIDGSATPITKRVFAYDGQLFEDPGQTYSIKDVRDLLAKTYPELANGTWHSRELPDGTTEITFVKTTGEKGSHLSAAQLTQALVAIEPQPSEAIILAKYVADKDGDLTAEELLDLGPAVEQALTDIATLEQLSKRIVDACLTLPAMPHPRVPLGF